MIIKDQLKADIDMIDEQNLIVLQQIINLFKQPYTQKVSIGDKFAELRQIMFEEQYEFPAIERTTRTNSFDSDPEIN